MQDSWSRDISDIEQIYYTYALAMDTKNWAMLDDVFTQDAVMDFAQYGGEHVGRGDVVAMIRRVVDTLDASQHLITNVRPVFTDTDTAGVTAYYHAQHVLESVPGDSHMIVGGIYHDEFVRTDEGWRIKHRLLQIVWTAGNPAVIGA